MEIQLNGHNFAQKNISEKFQNISKNSEISVIIRKFSGAIQLNDLNLLLSVNILQQLIAEIEWNSNAFVNLCQKLKIPEHDEQKIQEMNYYEMSLQKKGQTKWD